MLCISVLLCLLISASEHGFDVNSQVLAIDASKALSAATKVVHKKDPELANALIELSAPLNIYATGRCTVSDLEAQMINKLVEKFS